VRIALALVLGGSPLGCAAILGLDAPSRGADAGIDAVDAMLDAPPECPASYTLMLAASATRYQLVTTLASFAAQHAACNAAQPGRTHLASLDTLAEINALRSVVPARSYVGAVQMPNQSSDGRLDHVQWRAAAGGLDAWGAG
jgi:hypothetical protein